MVKGSHEEDKELVSHMYSKCLASWFADRKIHRDVTDCKWDEGVCLLDVQASVHDIPCVPSAASWLSSSSSSWLLLLLLLLMVVLEVMAKCEWQITSCVF